MISNYFKVALRNLARHKLSTFINVFGLSLGLACGIIIMLFVQSELSFDTFNSRKDNLYRVVTARKQVQGETDLSAYQPMPLVPALRTEFPEIRHAARFSTGGTIISSGEKAFTETVMFTDPDVFRMFDVTFLAGNPEKALLNPNEIILTQPMAEKYFGNTNPLGNILRIRTRASDENYVVAGVTGPMPGNSSLQFDFLANMTKHSMYGRAKDRWTSANGSAFVLLEPGTSQRQFEEKLPAFVNKYYGEMIKRNQEGGYLAKEENPVRISLQLLTDVHLDQTIGSSPEDRGNPAYSYILAGIGLLVLSIACINFVTLAIGRSAQRAREVGMRKVLGAVRSQIVSQFWGEAMFVCCVSLGLGLVMVELFLPTFHQLSGKQLSLQVLADGSAAAGIVILLLVVGVSAGSYPALYLSRFQPVETLKGKLKLGGNNIFTKVLIVFQFGLSIFLVCGALILDKQIHFLITKNLGFNVEQVVVLPMLGGDRDGTEALVERFRARVQENPDILNVSATNGAFTHGYDVNGFQLNGEQKTTFVYRIDERYLETLNIPLKEGRNFQKERVDDRERGIIVNEAFLRMMGWTEPAVGKRLTGTDSKMMENLEVVGVVKDFHFSSLRDQIRPALLFMNPEWNLDDLLIRIAPENIPATVQYLRSVWRELAPGFPFNATFLDEDFRKEYEEEMRWGRIVSYSSVFAVFLASLGLIGLITLAVTARTKEIGIRKVLGASGTGIVRLVSKEFLGLVLLGNLIAWPVAYLAATRFLEQYAYRIEIDLLTFLLAGGAALLVALLAIGGQIVKAVRSNPVEALRYE